MSIALPALPKEAAVTWRILSYGGDLAPALGGPVQRIRRMGSRFQVDVQLPKMDADCAAAWLAARARAEAEGSTVTMVVPQPNWPALIGAPVVDGAGRTGTTLVLRGLTGSQVLQGSRLFSFVSGGRTWLHMISAASGSIGTGAATLAIAPMLRTSPPDGTPVEFAAPVIEGFIAQGQEWSLERLTWVGASFTLSEER